MSDNLFKTVLSIKTLEETPVSAKRPFSFLTKLINKKPHLNIDFQLKSGLSEDTGGCITMVVGDNGCGKTTLIHALDPNYDNEKNYHLDYYSDQNMRLDYFDNFGQIHNEIIAVYPTAKENHLKENSFIDSTIELIKKYNSDFDDELFYGYMKEYDIDVEKK
ncbi:MAG: ABC transporter ATP-binding protein [Eubacteriales bacterium]|nr:ABC transporter ATP-binding protein [Eubacteriales bacterium]